MLRERLTESGFKVVEPEIKCNWNPKAEDLDKAKAIAEALCKQIAE